MKRIPSIIMTVFLAGLLACNDQKTADTEIDQKPDPMNSYISLFEIPATDVSRAIHFYEAILGVEIEQLEMPGMEMGVLPYENQTVPGIIIKDGNSRPSADGVTIYLNAGPDLQPFLDRIEAHGGQILVQKTAHADESGFFALFLDSEGNKLGLHSPH